MMAIMMYVTSFAQTTEHMKFKGVPMEGTTTVQTSVHRNANKHWGPKGDAYLRQLYREGKTPKEISKLMGRSYTSIIMRLQKLGELQ